MQSSARWYRRSFNPRPHTRGDGPCRLSYTHVFEFQSTPPRGRRQLVVDHGCSLSVVSIHAPARGATDWFCNAIASSRFQSTLPREGRQAGKPHLTGSLSFNPRPHARGDYFSLSASSWWVVSIHAPTRGATTFAVFPKTHLCFNPRPHARGDDFYTELTACKIVSIHAPTRGATIKHIAIGKPTFVSIHAPTRGATC